MVDAVNSFLPEPVYKTITSGVKVARPDIIIQDESVPADVMENMIFEEIGGEEILSTSRNDLINSPFNNIYQPIKNAKSNIKIPTLLDIPTSANTLTKYKPKTPGIDVIDKVDGKYSVDSSGRLVINLVDVGTGQQIEIQVYGASNYYDATIYGGA